MALTLEGIKVEEIAGAAAASMASRLMADWGADVVHIEHPVTGDTLRHVQASAGSAGTIGGGAVTIALSEIPYVMLNYNRGKRSLAEGALSCASFRIDAFFVFARRVRG